MELKIYTSKGAVRHTTDTTRKESTRVQQLMNDNYVQIVFDHTEELGFKAGDNITYKGEKFTLIQDYKAEVKNEYEYHYELKFEGAEGYFKTLPFFHYITNGDQTEKEPEVNYTATLAMTADMAVTSLRKASGDDTWQVGKLAEGDESKYLNFSADSVFDAFGKIADEFKTEWWIEGKKVNFSRCERGDLQTFSAKAGGGLSSVEIASNNEIVPNRIYAYGSDRNITKKYTAQGLAYNTRLRLPADIEYVEVTGGAENIISKTVFFDNDEIGNIYPRRVGIISKVEVGGTTEVPIYYFYDKGIDFDPKAQLIEGTTMMGHLESGMLQGRDLELGYDEKLKRFEIINTQEGDIQVPFGSIIPKVGDKYVLWNMEMPQSYITNAEQELLTVAQEYVDNLNKKTPEITCKSFEPYFDEYGKVVTIGSRIKIEDDRLKGGYIESRVTRYSYPLFCESQVEFTLSENVASGRLTQLENKVEDVTADNAQNVQYTRAVSRRGWRDAQELTTALEALQSELVLVGNPESQFSCSCVFKSNKNNDPNLLAISAGELQHVVYRGDVGDKWAIEGAEFTLAADTLYYMYFKCNKTTNKGNVIISQIRLGVESQEGYYLFLGGVVSSIFENARIVNIVSGFTQIAGGNITTERIQDPTGKLIIDLTSVPPRIIARNGAKFIGSFSFESADGLDNIAGIDDIKTDISTAQGSANDAQATANEAARATQAVNDYVQLLESDVNAEIVAVNKRLDGVIETYFFPYDPTLENYPANEWTTNALKESHNGDRFNNTSTGNSWKWKIVNDSWKWDEITDTFEKELLNKIAKVQSIADGKMQNFVLTPYTPYKAGDTWDQGPTGDSMRCIRSREYGVFDASDWDKASKYTDDSAVENLQFGGVNFALNTAADRRWNLWGDGVVCRYLLSDNTPSGEALIVRFTTTNVGASPEAFGIGWGDASAWSGQYFAGEYPAEGKTFEYRIPKESKHTAVWIYFNTATTVHHFYVQSGNKPSDWSLAPEDVKADAEQAAAQAAAGVRTSAVNYLKDSRLDSLNWWETNQGVVTLVDDPKFGTVVQYQRVSGAGNFQRNFAIYNRAQFSNRDVIYYLIAKDISGDGKWTFGGWPDTAFRLDNTTNPIDLGGGWKMYWVTFKAGASIGDGEFGINSTTGTWQFYAAGVSLGKNPPSSWTIAEGDLSEGIRENTKRLADWASDGIISPVEKTGLRQQRAAIAAEYAQVKTNAERYSVSTEAYTAAYNAAIAALDKYTASSPNEIPIDKEIKDYNNISAYYTAHKTISDAIAVKANVSGLKKIFAEDTTEIEGGVMLSSFMGVRDANGAMSAGIAGYGDLPFIFARPGKGSNFIEQANDSLFMVDRDAGLGRWGIFRITKEAVYVDGEGGQLLEFRNTPIESLGKLLGQGGIVPSYTPTGVFNLVGELPTPPATINASTATIYATNTFATSQGGYKMNIRCTVRSELLNKWSSGLQGLASAQILLISSESLSPISVSNTVVFTPTDTPDIQIINTTFNISSAGTYKLGFKLTANALDLLLGEGSFETLERFQTKISVTVNDVSFKLVTQKTIFGTNGLALVYGSGEYVAMTKDIETGNFQFGIAQQSWSTKSDVPIGGVYKDENGFLKVR